VGSTVLAEEFRGLANGLTAGFLLLSQAVTGSPSCQWQLSDALRRYERLHLAERGLVQVKSPGLVKEGPS